MYALSFFVFANHALRRKRTVSLSIWPKEKRFLDSALRCPKKAAGLRFSLLFSTAAVIEPSLPLPPAAGRLNSKEKGQQGKCPLHPSVQEGNGMRSTVALNFYPVLTPTAPCTNRFVIARTRFTLARMAIDAGFFARLPLVIAR